jgi:DNA polymerase-4
MPQSLFKLGLRDFPGIGPSMHARLLKSGIRTVEELWNLSRAELRRIWGGIGVDRWWHMIRGSREVDYEANVREERKSVGHSHVLPPQFRSLEGSRGILLRLVSRALKRMRAYELAGRSAHLHVRFAKAGFSPQISRRREEEPSTSTRTTTRTMSEPNTQYPTPNTRSSWDAHCSVAIHANDDITWMSAVRRALDTFEIPRGYFPLKVGVTFTDLILCENANLNLFGEAAKRARLFQTVDALNERFGHVVDLASVFWLRDEAPYRIAFGASLLDAVR